jgi:glycosyltransferase involved in cell wall biosynthesis
LTTKVAFVLKGYPRLSETFVAQEIRALERLGLSIVVFSLRRPTDPAVHPVHREIEAPVRYLPEYLRDDPVRVAAAWRALRHLPGYRAARRTWLADLGRDRTSNRIRRFGQALVLARELPADVGWLHSHFLHTPASVTRYAAEILGLPWSVSAHAKDIWTIPDWEKAEKLTSCQWAVTCTEAGAEHLRRLAPDRHRVELVYHGLDLCRFPAPERSRPPRAGSEAGDPVCLLSVSRAIAKKGSDVLLAALARLPANLHWQLVHVGGGPLLADLQRQAAAAGIADRVRWLGAQPQEVLLACYRSADLFVLASRIAADGDRDGLPNVLLEAQSQGLACVSTRISGIPELLIDGETGILVPPEDSAALATAIERLIRSPPLRDRLGAAGLRQVHRAFSLGACIEPLAIRFGVAQAEALRCGSRSTRP